MCCKPNGKRWETTIYTIGEQVTLKSINLELPIEELYPGHQCCLINPYGRCTLSEIIGVP